jgi:hypothetical protein
MELGGGGSATSYVSGVRTGPDGLNVYTEGESVMSRFSLRVGHLIDYKVDPDGRDI